MAKARVYISVLGDSSSAVRAFKQAEREMARLGVASKTMSDKIGRGLTVAGKKMTDAGRSMTRHLTLPIVGAGVASVKMAAEFEDSLQRMIGLAGVAKADVKTMSDEVLKLAQRLPQSPAELADALFFITSSGFADKPAEALKVLETSARAAATGLGETKTVADAITSVLNAYGHANISAAKAADILTATVKAGKGEADAIAGAVGRVIPIAAEMGVEFDQVGGSIAAMTRTGLDANEAVTALRGFLSLMLKPAQQSKKAMSELGLTAGDVARVTGTLNLSLAKGGMSVDRLRKIVAEKGLFEGMIALKTALGGNVEAMGDAIPNVRALAGFLSQTGKNAAENAVIFANLKNSTGEMDKAFAATSETSMFKFKVAMASMQAAGIRVGNALLPTVTRIVNKVGDLADAFSRLSPEQQKTILKWGAIAAAAGPVLRVLGPMTTGVGKMFTQFAKGSKALKDGAGALGMFGKAGALLRMAPLVGLGLTLGAVALKMFVFKGRTDSSEASLRTWKGALAAAKTAADDLAGAKLNEAQAALDVKVAQQQLTEAHAEVARLEREGIKSGATWRAAKLAERQAILSVKQAEMGLAGAKKDTATAAATQKKNLDEAAAASKARAAAFVTEAGKTVGSFQSSKERGVEWANAIEKRIVPALKKGEIKTGDVIAALANLPRDVRMAVEAKVKAALDIDVSLSAAYQRKRAEDVAHGGIVRATPGGTHLRAGEDGGDEAIVPLAGRGLARLQRALRPAGRAVAAGAGGQQTFIMNNTFTIGAGASRMDAQALVRKMERPLTDMLRRAQSRTARPLLGHPL